MPFLRCPACHAALSLAGASVRCRRGHAYDVARQGYVNLATGQPPAGTADTPAMVAARSRFLASGHYAPIAEALAGAAARLDPAPRPGAVLDVAGGTGYHLAAVLDAVTARAGICLDISKAELRRAARSHPRAAAVGADVWRSLPLPDGAAAIGLSVFGPRNPGELARVLAPGGVWLLVTPTAQHLGELIEPLGMISVDAAKQERLAESLESFERLAERTLTYRADLGHALVSDLVLMGPSAHHLAGADLERGVAALPETVAVTISVRLAAYRPA
jgi:23S rRNA (guanine745-N1)-methyltransferase